MVSPRALRWWAGFFACAGVTAAMAGLLFGLGLLLAPASAIAPQAGDAMWAWVWAVPAGGLLLSLAAVVQAVKGRPVLVPRDLHKGPLFRWSGPRLNGVMALLTMVGVTFFLIALGAYETVSAHEPRMRAAAWSMATIAFGSAALPLVGFSIAVFHAWWRRQDPSSVTSRTCEHCGYSLAGVGPTRRCPECGGGVNGA